MQNNVSIAVAYATILGALLREAGLENDNKSVRELRKRIKKFLNTRARTNPKFYKEGFKMGQTAWNKTIDYYEEKCLKIEAASAIIGVWSSQDTLLSKFCKLTDRVMEEFGVANYIGDNEFETESNALAVAKHLAKEINIQCI